MKLVPIAMDPEIARARPIYLSRNRSAAFEGSSSRLVIAYPYSFGAFEDHLVVAINSQLPTAKEREITGRRQRGN